MADKILDSSQWISGVAVLLSFFVGYKYGLKIRRINDDTEAPKRNLAVNGEYKMVLCVRNDLKMGKGKIGAQCGHAAVGAYQTAVIKYPDIVEHWEHSGCMKVALRVDSKDAITKLYDKARKAKLNTCLIRDAGRTQIEPNTITVLGIGPALCDDIDRITGNLKLL